MTADLLPPPRWQVARGAVGMLVLSCLFWTGCEPQGPKALLEGERVLKQERYNEAIALFQLATEKIPREARAWNLLGLAYQGAGLSSEAAQAYSKALALDHKLSAAHYNLGCLYLEQDQTQLAVTELTAFTLLQPRAVEGWLRLASAQTRVNRLDAAEVCYRNALTLVPKHPEALNGMGYVSVSRRRYIEAIQYFQIALAESPNYGPALLNQAVVTHRHLNQRVTALQKYRAYLALQPRPDNWEAVNQVAQNLADELAGSNRAPAATALTNTVYRTNPAPTAASLANNTARTVVTQSLTAVQPPVVVPPSRPAAGQPATATPTPTPPAAIRPTVALPPQPAPPPASVPSTAAVVLSPVRETVPPPPEVVISEVGREMNIKPAADPVLPPPQPGSRPATTIASGSPAAAAAPSVAPQRTAPPPVAANEDRPGFFQRLNPFRSRPKNDPPLPASVRADPPRSATPANAAREISATQVQATLADALPTEGFPRYAYRQAVRPNAGDRQKAAELVNKGILAHRDRRAEEEVNFYRSATLVDPSNYDAFFNLGLASAEQGDWTTALHAYEQALNIDPDSVNGRYNFAAALRQSNYPIDAARELEAILQTRPDDGKTLLALGNLYAQKFKQNRTARYYYLRMLEAEPNHPKAAEVRFWLTSNP